MIREIKMGFRFRQSVRLFPGVRVNFSLSGMSVSAGIPGMRLNVGTRRSTLTMGIPGTGLSYVHSLSSGTRHQDEATTEPRLEHQPEAPPSTPSPAKESLQGEIRSAEIATLTSPDLAGLKQLINEAASQKRMLEPDWNNALKERLKTWKKLRRREQFPLSVFAGWTVPKAQTAFAVADEEALKVASALAASEIKISVEFDEQTWAAWERVVTAHRAMSLSTRTWDVTSSVATDQIKERTIASNAISRTLVALRPTRDAIVSTNHGGLCFENANGGDLNLFPGFLLIREKSASDYALVDMREINVQAMTIKFIENEDLPLDAKIVGSTWAKANKDGSPDRRFKENHQIPIVSYGKIYFTSSSGIFEGYLLSRSDAALEFGFAMQAFQMAMRGQASNPKDVFAADDESNQIDPAQRLPQLPEVRGAYETIVIPVAMAAGFSFFQPLAQQAEMSSPTNNAAHQTAATNSTKFIPAQKIDVASSQPTSEPQQIVRSLAAQTALERMVTVSGANLRSGPDRNAPSLRVIKAGTILVILDRNGSWARVGDGQSEPWGWVHMSLLKKQM
ncbi:DUF4236 domain-containing protein [Methylocella sp. CPCC 101449]|uniref:DUF4236 domain-containing protein n=1 Tax=Methylocella sp. CPCC 101449 TaxID=2987531 RepID=UPI0028926241|nr:DUF4236 domain-containing protein [Methylocella sp. CPCC 101449]MDT2022357.1 DUF4236 domain-containing protein [Methylocella sp. CPCC 101449]